ncbi:SPV103 putative virulence factor [Swinepox virus]|uniref:SPV103 putative virulence factor n=1 Tax=Swinepox virus (strain Swine/Nebraska/17077-99/1999) TaxID=300880 RepID=Q8V3J3_SWPV1|nr:IMV membrane receptor-like protein [Swinepox virus]AAL69842.1 SPV103 putative virulence factor [Swinepox virus]UED36686.1 IMV membrane receptor-like protein [Swinepox virus]UED36837.1 IMV membrane receptor-like protein [Swinepox virus]UUA44293.1 SPV103 [Swinepox virus]
MVTNYEPLILLGIICVASLANIKLSIKVKMDIIFFIQSILFMWFILHFVHSVL